MPELTFMFIIVLTNDLLNTVVSHSLHSRGQQASSDHPAVTATYLVNITSTGQYLLHTQIFIKWITPAHIPCVTC